MVTITNTAYREVYKTILCMQLCEDISSALVSQNVEINYRSLSQDLWQVSNIESPRTLEDNGRIKKYRVNVRLVKFRR